MYGESPNSAPNSDEFILRARVASHLSRFFSFASPRRVLIGLAMSRSSVGWLVPRVFRGLHYRLVDFRRTEIFQRSDPNIFV